MTFHEWFTARSDAWVAREGSFASLAKTIGCDAAMITNWRKGAALPSARSLLPAVARTLAADQGDARTLYELCGVDLSPVLDAGAA